eukprot:tig00000310_g23964.t1
MRRTAARRSPLGALAVLLLVASVELADAGARVGGGGGRTGSSGSGSRTGSSSGSRAGSVGSGSPSRSISAGGRSYTVSGTRSASTIALGFYMGSLYGRTYPSTSGRGYGASDCSYTAVACSAFANASSAQPACTDGDDESLRQTTTAGGALVFGDVAASVAVQGASAAGGGGGGLLLDGSGGEPLVSLASESLASPFFAASSAFFLDPPPPSSSALVVGPPSPSSPSASCSALRFSYGPVGPLPAPSAPGPAPAASAAAEGILVFASVARQPDGTALASASAFLKGTALGAATVPMPTPPGATGSPTTATEPVPLGPVGVYLEQLRGDDNTAWLTVSIGPVPVLSVAVALALWGPGPAWAYAWAASPCPSLRLSELRVAQVYCAPSGGLSAAAVAAVAIGSVVVACLLAACAAYAIRSAWRKKRGRRGVAHSPVRPVDGSPTPWMAEPAMSYPVGIPVLPPPPSAGCRADEPTMAVCVPARAPGPAGAHLGAGGGAEPPLPGSDQYPSLHAGHGQLQPPLYPAFAPSGQAPAVDGYTPRELAGPEQAAKAV